MYRNDIWKIDQGWETRNQKPFKRLVGRFLNPQEAIQDALEELENSFNSISKKLDEKAALIIKTIEETLQKAAGETVEKAIERIKTASDEIVAQAKDSLIDMKQKVAEEIKETVTNSIKENSNIQNSAKTSKAGKILAFGSGIAVAAIGGGAWYFSKVKKNDTKTEEAANQPN